MDHEKNLVLCLHQSIDPMWRHQTQIVHFGSHHSLVVEVCRTFVLQISFSIPTCASYWILDTPALGYTAARKYFAWQRCFPPYSSFPSPPWLRVMHASNVRALPQIRPKFQRGTRVASFPGRQTSRNFRVPATCSRRSVLVLASSQSEQVSEQDKGGFWDKLLSIFEPKAAETMGQVVSQEVPREKAVLVFGATGKVGREVVKHLLNNGHVVVAATRAKTKAQSVLGQMDLKKDAAGRGGLIVEDGVDITDASTLTEGLFKGVEKIICCVGPVFGQLPGGGMGYLDNMTSERVDAEGVANIMEAAKKFLKKPEIEEEVILGMTTQDDLENWDRLDDVIMGGQSKSTLELKEDDSGLIFSGELIVEGGGFCGQRTKPASYDLSRFSGLKLRVRGDGQIYKINIKTENEVDVPESVYQTTFETANGDWTTHYIPWHEFVPVTRANFNPQGPPMDTSKISMFTLVLSRFEFNSMPNPAYRPGNFKLEVEGGISAYKAITPQIVMLSSAGVERNALIGDNEELRKQDIPIVQLNPGGTLNHKYSGENAVRASGLPYAVIRSTGMSDQFESPCLLEAQQGDMIVGQIARAEVGSVLAEALDQPAAAFKTMEIRRSAGTDAKNREMAKVDFRRMFLQQSLDRNRWKVGLSPFPVPVAPPPPPTEERKQEILQDTRVQRARQEGGGGTVRNEEESNEAGTVTIVDDGRKEAGPIQQGE